MTDRENQLLETIPEALNYKSLLYIGARPERQEMLNLFLEKNYTVTILEVFKPNYDKLIELNKERKLFDYIEWGDVRDIPVLFVDNADVVMWWHGPEHIELYELEKTLEIVESKAEKITILGCPNGVYFQNEVYGNPYEIHKSFLYPKNFERLGYQTKVIGEPDVMGGNILSWKKKG